MTTLLQLVAYMTVLTWVSIMAGAFLRNREWTPDGMKIGLGEEATLGAQVFFWARLVYLPVYWAGITYVRSAVWGVGIAGLAMMLFAIV